MSYDHAKNEILVVVTDFNYDELRKSIADSIELAFQGGIETDTCGVDIHGKSSCEETGTCPNTRYDGISSTYCVATHARKLSLRRDNYNFLPSMLEYYWQNGIEEKAIHFLRNSEYVTSYRSVA
jgi:hypothetical protein